MPPPSTHSRRIYCIPEQGHSVDLIVLPAQACVLSAALVHQREETLGQILDSTQSLYTLFHTYIRLHSKLALVSSPQHALRFPFPGACPWGSCSARETHPLGLKRHDVIVRALEARTTAFELLAQHADATVLAAVGPTPLGRGLVAGRSIAPRDPVVSLPVHNTLLVADDPIDGISIFSDRQHRRWQELHGSLPEQLLEFLQGESRWDIRMAAWLLYMKQHQGPLWTNYMLHLPHEQDMCCLLNYSRDEIAELQIPALQSEAVIQADWAAFLHGNYLHSRSGELASLGLSDSLPCSLWAISMVRSRTFSEDVNGEALTLMVPFADLANHNFDNNCTFCLGCDNQSFQLRALRPLTAGDEITISYGAIKPNAELLRDYGFFVPGNPCDRINWKEMMGTGSSGGTISSSMPSMTGTERELRLNPVSLLKAVGFSGDLAAAQLGDSSQIQAIAQSLPHDTLRLARRTAALLSMPLNTPLAAASGRGSTNSQKKTSNGFAGWWFGESMRAWTPSGQPNPLPLTDQQVPAERAMVDTLKQQLLQQIATLPTSIATDEELLLLHQHASCSSGCSRHSGSNASTVLLPLRTVNSSNWRVHTHPQQLHQQGVQQTAAALQPPYRTRLVTAIGARLEHKLLLREAVAVLMMYEGYLEAFE